MSIRVMTSVWQYSACKGSELLLLLAIADRADDDGYAWPKVATLAAKTRMSERSTQYNLKRLIEVGELECEVGAGPYGTNMYRVITRATEVQTLHQGGAKFAPQARKLCTSSGAIAIAPNTSIDSSIDSSKKRKAIAPTIAVHAYDERFESFWQHYPRKVNKRNAEAAFLKLAPDDALLARMVAAIQAQAESATFRDLDHAPHGSSWINGARWEDEVLPAAAASATMPMDSTTRDRAAFDEARRILNGTGGGLIIETTGGLVHP